MKMKNHSEVRKHCTPVVVRPQTGGAGQPKSNQLKMVTTFT